MTLWGRKEALSESYSLSASSLYIKLTYTVK